MKYFKKFIIVLALGATSLCGALGLDDASKELTAYAARMKELDTELAAAEKTIATQKAALTVYVQQRKAAEAQLLQARNQVNQFVTTVRTLGPGLEKINEAERVVKAIDAQIASLTAQFNAGRTKPLADLQAAQRAVATIRARIDANKAQIERLKREIDQAPDLGKKIEYGIVKGAAITDLGFKIAGDEIAYGTAMGVLRAAEDVVRKIPAGIDPRVSALQAQRGIVAGALTVGRGLVTSIGNQGALVLVNVANPVFTTLESLMRVILSVDTLLQGALSKLDQLAQEVAAARAIIPEILTQNGIAQEKVRDLQRFIADLQASSQ